MLDTRACAVTGCREACPASHLMCIRHWRMVPVALRREVGAAFSRWRRAISRSRGRGCTQDTFNTITHLRETQQMAIAAVIEKEVKRDLAKQEGQDRLFPPSPNAG